MLLQCTFGIYVTRQHARANGCLRVYDVLFLICGGMFLHVCDALPFCAPAHRKTHFATKWLFGFMSCVLLSNSFWSSYKDLCIEYLESTTSCRCGNKAFQEIESGFCLGASEEVAVFYGCRERREMSGWSCLSWKGKCFFEYFLRYCVNWMSTFNSIILISPKQTNNQTNKAKIQHYRTELRKPGNSKQGSITRKVTGREKC